MQKIGSKGIILIVLLVFGFGVRMSAQNVSADVSTDSVLIGHYFQLRISANNVQGSIEMPDFPDFDVIGGPNQSSSMQIINGEMSSSQGYTFLLKPRAEGMYTIDPIFWIDGDTTYATDPIVIHVWPNPDNIPQQPMPMTLQFEDRTKELGVSPKEDLRERYKAKKKLKVTKT